LAIAAATTDHYFFPISRRFHQQFMRRCYSIERLGARRQIAGA
jgi:hypothetical protein